MRLPDLERRLFEPVICLLDALNAWENRWLGHGRLRASVDMIGFVVALVVAFVAIGWLQRKVHPPFGPYWPWRGQ